MRLGYCYELATERGVPFASCDCEIESELRPAGSVSINGVFVGKENLFNGDILHRSLACAIAGEAENKPWVLAALEDEAADEFAERQMRRVFA